MTKMREAAEKIVAQMKGMGEPRTVRAVSELAFPHLSLDPYRRFRDNLESHGCRYLGDYEIINDTLEPVTLMAKTMVRCMISRDSETCAAYYQVRPHVQRRLANLFVGIFEQLNIVSSTATFLRSLQTGHIYDFASELADTFVVTSNAAVTAAFNSPPLVDRELVPEGASLDRVRIAHTARLASARARLGAEPTKMSNLDEVLAMEDRLRVRKHAHRAASGWITLDELVRFAHGNTTLAQQIFTEVQAINNQR